MVKSAGLTYHGKEEILLKEWCMLIEGLGSGNGT
jgi:hypothetical protein